jgi:Fuc2NAc and GlcNAc transferase
LTFALSVLFCGLYLRLARRWRIVDEPNERSSHRAPTPHGGGAALLSAFVTGLLLTAVYETGWPWPYGLLVVMTLLLMGLGIIDDLLALSVRLRLPLYGLACLLTAWVLWPSSMSVATAVWLLLVALAMLWLVNLYNFMDGIDGIAATQCVLACGAAALLCARGAGSHYALFCLLLGASHLGFLVWNWPPARLFMGDAGSVPTGFLLAALALLGSVQGQLHPACWLVLLAVFITDASWTLLWRMATGQPFTRPHRLHAYQRLSAYWGSHRRVDLLLVVIFLCWLLPLAWLLQNNPDHAFLLVILAYLPLLLGMAKIRALA